MDKKSAVTSALVIAALTVGTGAAAAAPADLPSNPSVSTDILPGIHYRASLVDNSVVVTTDAGSLITAGNRFQVLDGLGQLVAGTPLTYQRDGKDWPIATRIDGNTAILTPSTDPSVAVRTTEPALPLHSVNAVNPHFHQALTNFGSETALGMAIGGLIGTAIGAGIGCIAGATIVGGAAGVATIGTLAVPGAIGGCLVTGAAAAGIGAIVGTIVVGVPVAIAAAIVFFNDINSSPPPTN